MSALKSKIASWRDGSAGFFRFLEDVKPMVRSHRGGYEPFVPGPRERAEIVRALDGGYSTVVLCWPRRHGKTLTAAMIVLWRFLTRRTENVAMVANSEKQVVDVGFRTIAEALKHTPFLKALVDNETLKVGVDRIDFPAAGSVIGAFSANPAALWGKKLTVAQVSELHAARSEAVLEVLEGSLLDSEGSLLLIDSTVGPRSSPLFGLYQVAQRGDDPTLLFSHIEYADLDDACRNGPPWIKPEGLRSLAGKMLPQRFGMFHLNRWQDGASALFPPEILKDCIDEYPLDPKAIAAGATVIVGGGLDRAFGGSKHGDATVTTAVLKTVIDEDEHFFVLASEVILLGRLSGIKSELTRYHRDFGMSHFTAESYNAQDVADWATGQPFGANAEVVHPSRKIKYRAFLDLYTAAAEGRLHIHPRFARLISEMETFEVIDDGRESDGEAAVPKFQHAKGCHDDAVHALAWAVYSLRAVELNPYEVNGIVCNAAGPAVALCVLNGGGHVPPCADACRSMREAHRLFAAHRERRPTTPLDFTDFVARKLKNVGAHILPR